MLDPFGEHTVAACEAWPGTTTGCSNCR